MTAEEIAKTALQFHRQNRHWIDYDWIDEQRRKTVQVERIERLDIRNCPVTSCREAVAKVDAIRMNALGCCW